MLKMLLISLLLLPRYMLYTLEIHGTNSDFYRQQYGS